MSAPHANDKNKKLYLYKTHIVLSALKHLTEVTQKIKKYICCNTSHVSIQLNMTSIKHFRVEG